ncbi:hypothetical protein BDV97DRAFT_67295 [Delphinella strobiligena]|nr:hypothetical protein BDV97DRAFT_67295 [Delphinella strobiligena]
MHSIEFDCRCRCRCQHKRKTRHSSCITTSPVRNVHKIRTLPTNPTSKKEEGATTQIRHHSSTLPRAYLPFPFSFLQHPRVIISSPRGTSVLQSFYCTSLPSRTPRKNSEENGIVDSDVFDSVESIGPFWLEIRESY